MKIIIALFAILLAAPASAGYSCTYQHNKDKTQGSISCTKSPITIIQLQVQTKPTQPTATPSAPGTGGNPTVGTDADGKLIFK